MEGDWKKYWNQHPQNPSLGESNASPQGFSPFTQESNAFQTAGIEGINLNAQFAAASDPEVEEIASMPPTTKQRGHYSPPETILICRLYLEHTNDSVVGVDQKGAQYWGAIVKRYNAERPEGTIPRDIKQIKSHFQRVQKDVKLWEGIYQKCRENWASGMSDEQISDQAEKMFIGEHRSQFKYPYAWKILRESRKFASIGEDVHSDKRSKGSDGRNTTTSSDQSTATRPQGQKAAKRDKGKGKNKAETSDENAQALGYMAEMVKVMGQFSQTQRDLADSMLLSRDTSQMNPDELAFHLHKVAEIKQRNNLP